MCALINPAQVQEQIDAVEFELSILQAMQRACIPDYILSSAAPLDDDDEGNTNFSHSIQLNSGYCVTTLTTMAILLCSSIMIGNLTILSSSTDLRRLHIMLCRCIRPVHSFCCGRQRNKSRHASLDSARGHLFVLCP
jgi:hypothetical protein